MTDIVIFVKDFRFYLPSNTSSTNLTKETVLANCWNPAFD